MDAIAFDVAVVDEAGREFAQSEVSACNAVADVAEVLGQIPSFERWEAVFTVWSKAYQARRVCDDAAVKAARSRFYRRLKEIYGIEKPASTSAKAQEKSVKRAEAAATAQAAFDEFGGDIAAMREAAATAFGEANKARFEVMQAAIKLAEKETASMTADAVKSLKEELRKLMKDATADKLQAAIEALQ